MEVRNEYHGTAPIDLKAGHTYAVTLADVTTLGTGDGESDVVIFHWDISTAKEVIEESFEDLDFAGAFKDLKDAGPGAICEACGHFATRHHEKGDVLCDFNDTLVGVVAGVDHCRCPGFTWQDYVFAINPRTGPMYVIRKAS